MYLEDQALTWFNDNVDGFYHQKQHWFFKEVITGLYDWFIYDTATHDITDKFWHVKFNASEGVMSYYHNLERYASRMIRPPDRFTFKNQFLTGLPENITLHILRNGATIKHSRMARLLQYATEAEEISRVTKCFTE